MSAIAIMARPSARWARYSEAWVVISAPSIHAPGVGRFVRWIALSHIAGNLSNEIIEKCCLTDKRPSFISECMKKYRTTPEIEKVALKLGATHNQIYIWRKKGVAVIWQRFITHASRGKIKSHDFLARTE